MKAVPWYQSWFGEDYLSVYSGRNQAEAAQQISFILAELPFSPPLLTLDIGTGSGRHLFELRSRGITAIGIDLSSTLLTRAKAHLSQACRGELSRYQSTGQSTMPLPGGTAPPPLLLADMLTLPFSQGGFDLALNLFTTFGYFESDMQHLATLTEWRRVLKPGGILCLDLFNRDQIIANLVPETVATHADSTVTQRREISSDGLRLNKTIEIVSTSNRGGSSPRIYRESVRLYSPSEVLTMATAAGFKPWKIFGDFLGAPFSESAERFILFAEAI